MVSVIVPARNEEACLGRCLQSLVSQQGIGFEIIVIDDASTDRTGEIARSFVAAAGVMITVVPAPPLPENWSGKNNAMSAGANIAKGKWLLFTDADTFHKPGSLARAVTEAEHEGAALLSYSPEQEVQTLLEKAVMPVIFAELASTYPPAKVRDPDSPIAAANGQYLMIARETYDAVGGHTRIAGDLLEDVAMARLVKSSGRKIWFRYGGAAVSTRMYRSWPQMKEGWTKNLAVLFQRSVLYCLMLMGMWAFSWATVGLAVDGLLAGHFRAVVYAVPLLFLYARIACGRLGAANSFFGLVLGVPLASYLLLRSARARAHRTVVWKGRNY